MKVLAKNTEEVLADMDKLGQLAYEVSGGVGDYATFLLLKCIEVNEGGSVRRLEEVFNTFLAMKEYMASEHQAQQESSGNGDEGSSGEVWEPPL